MKYVGLTRNKVVPPVYDNKIIVTTCVPVYCGVMVITWVRTTWNLNYLPFTYISLVREKSRVKVCI